jgi:hypothetical protein
MMKQSKKGKRERPMGGGRMLEDLETVKRSKSEVVQS